MRHPRSLEITLLLASMATSACASDEGPEVPYALGARPVLPFPTDALLEPDPAQPTGARVAIGPEGTNLGDVDEALYLFGADFVASLDRIDGWSTLAPVFLRLGEEPDLETVREHAHLVDLEAHTVVPVSVRTLGGQTKSGRETHWIALRPWFPLRPKARHALVLTRGLRAASGPRFQRSTTFEAVLEGEPTERIEGEARRIEAAKHRLAGVGDALERAGIRVKDVLVADTFTTQSIMEPNDALADAFRRLPVPRLEHGIGDARTYAPASTDPRWRAPRVADESGLHGVARVRFRLPSFRGPGDGRLADVPDAPLEEEDEEALITLPEGPGPFQVVVYQHGLGDTKEGMWPFANALARRGIALVAFDAPLHGVRSPDGASAGAAFLDVLDPVRLADNFRQAMTEHAYFVRVVDGLMGLDLYGDGTHRLDARRLFWFGVSLGAIIGGGAIGIEPRYEGAALVVGGGTLLEFVERAIGGLALDQYPAELFVSLVQTVLDRGDPSNYGARTADKQVLLMQAMEDEIIPRASTEALGRALGLPQLEPVYERVEGVEQKAGPMLGRGWSQFSPATHAMAMEPDENPAAYERSRAQVFRFLESWSRGGIGAIQ